MADASSQPIRPDVDRMLRQAYPQGAMAPALDIQKSHLAGVFPRLKTRLLELDGAAVGCERDPLGGDGWRAGDGRLPSGPGSGERDEPPSSYYLFFLAATAEPCRTGDESLKIGYSLALSVMAPAALLVLNHMEEDDFSQSVPDVAPDPVEDASGEEMEIERFCQTALAPAGHAALERLNAAIAAAVEEFGFLILPEAEQAKPIPWLAVPAMPFAKPARLSVRDALFFYAMAAA